MRVSRGFVRFVGVVLAGLLGATSVRAQLLVAATSGEPPAIEHAELAYAQGDGTPVTWLALRIQRGPAALVAALPDGVTSRAALDAWLASLETTASPNVLPPHDATNCGNAQNFVHVAWPRSPGVAGSELNLERAEDVNAALAELGLEVPERLPQASHYLVWSWPAADTEQTTRTLRIEGGPAPLTFLPGSPFPVSVSAITRGAMTFPIEVNASDLSVTFVAGKPSTNYFDVLRHWLDGNAAPLLESRGRGSIFDWGIYADRVSLAPLVNAYAHAAGLELKDLDVDACSEQLRGLRKAGAPTASACGEATDAELALNAVGSELATLQRFAVPGSLGFSPSSTAPSGDPSPPVLRARVLDDAACPTAPLPPLKAAPGASRDTGTNGSGTTDTTVVEETTVVDSTTTATEINCGGSTQPGYSSETSDDSGCSSDSSSSSTDSSCSGDSSSSSSSNDSSCSGDSSSSSESNDSSCSGDSSSSSDSKDSSCSGDSSSSSDSKSDSGCSSDSSGSSYNGDTCTGSAAPGAEKTEKAQSDLTSSQHSRGPRRLKTSLWALALAGVTLPIRRRKRG